MECVIDSCIRDTDNEFCTKHNLARDNIRKNFDKWKNAYGDDYSEKEYYTRLAEDYDIGAGTWVIEVAKHYLENKKL